MSALKQTNPTALNGSIFALRFVLGWLFFVDGITKIIDPSWSAAEVLDHAQTLPSLFQWFASPDVLPAINVINEWALLLLGISLLAGLFVRLSSSLGIVLLGLYYLAQFNFPYASGDDILIDKHVIYAVGLYLLIHVRAGRYWGLDGSCAELPWCKKHPKIRALMG